MGSVLDVVTLALLAAVAGWRLCAPRSSRRQRLVAMILVPLAVSTLANLAGPARFVDRVTGVPDLAVLLKNVLALAAVMGATAFVSSMSGAVADGWRGERVGYALTAVVVGAMIGLFCGIPRDFGGPDFVDEHAGSVAVASYGLLYQLCFGVNVGLLGVRLRRYWRRAGHLLRFSLLMMWVGAMLAVVYVLNRMVFLVSHVVGMHAIQGPIYVVVSQTLLATALLPVAVGTGFTTLWVLGRWALDYRALALLYPLWDDLRRAVPDVVLDGPRHRLADVCTLRAARLRLYRRVIEIRDAQWALRGHLSVAVREEALRQARLHGVAEPGLAAVADACALQAALRAHLGGEVPLVRAGVEPASGGADVDSEIRTLLAIAAARRTAFVRHFGAAGTATAGTATAGTATAGTATAGTATAGFPAAARHSGSARVAPAGGDGAG